LLAGHAQAFAERHHAAVMGIVYRRIVHFLDVHIADHVGARLDHRTIADDVAEPARKMISEVSVLRSKNSRSLDGQVFVDEFEDLGFSFPPGIGNRAKNIFLGDHKNFLSCLLHDGSNGHIG
jgi:hypothetical protein